MPFKFNIPITKVDEEKRLVYGLVTEEIVDQAGEILDYETSKAYFQEWSDGISKASGGASLGNLRLMHQPTIAGKLVELNFDDVLKQISCVAKIVSDDVWKLVLEGCLTGFSMGGKYVKRWKDAAIKGVHRFTAKPVEVSVVDNPCVTTATFEYVKADGSIELRKFHSAGDGNQEEEGMFTQAQIAARAAELAKAAGTPDATDDFMDEALVQLEANKADQADHGDEDPPAGDPPAPAEEPAGDPPAQDPPAGDSPADKAAKPPFPPKDTKDGEEEEEAEESDEDKAKAKAKKSEDAALTLVQVWQAPDGRTFAKKADAVAALVDGEPVVEEEDPVEKALRIARGEPEAPAIADEDLADLDVQLGKALELFNAAEAEIGAAVAEKSMYEVRSLSSVITDLRYVISSLACEQNHNGNPGTVPATLLGHLKGLAAALVTLTEEEVAAMISSLGNNYPSALGIVENSALAEFTKDDSPVMLKVGARNSKNDAARIQASHDTMVGLGAACSCDDATKAAIIDEGLEDSDVVKTLRTTLEKRDEQLEKALTGIGDLGDRLRDAEAKIEKFGKEPKPLPPRTDHIVVERLGKSETIGVDDLEKMSADQRADLAIRLSQMAPTHVGGK